jgi:hypothetical protein
MLFAGGSNALNAQTSHDSLLYPQPQFFFAMAEFDVTNGASKVYHDSASSRMDKQKQRSLYDYLSKKKPKEELFAEDITDDIDKHFHAGFVLHWDDCLNHWLVDYDIIRILKRYVGYSSWTNVPTKQRGLCYKNYNQSVTLPEWDIEQERY